MSDSQTAALQVWMSGYREAWESNDPAEIGNLFTDDALYYNEPFSPPARGREAIIRMWLEREDAAGTTTFTWGPVVVTDDLAIVQGETDYGTVKFSNLWVIRFGEDGRATEFTEWWMDQAKPSSG
jgi:ketosteroid isomerase-like protein